MMSFRRPVGSTAPEYDVLSGVDRGLVDLWAVGKDVSYGTLPPTGKRMDAPCCDVLELAHGKIRRFDCYPSGSVILTQLGVLRDLDAALQHWHSLHIRLGLGP
jgi:hypothetical protein